MSNIATLREEIKSDVHSLVSDADINRKIVSAMRHMRDKRLWWNERTFTFTLIAGVQAYAVGAGPPADLVEIVGSELQLLIGGNEDQIMSMWRVPSREWEARRYAGTQQDQPRLWDFWANQLRFYPVPDSSTDVIRGRYVRDIGVPETRYDSTAAAFKFYAPGGTEQLSTADLDGFTNDFLDPRGGYYMVKARAMHELYKSTLKDADAANEQLALWLEAVGQIEAENEGRGGAVEILGCLLDTDDDVNIAVGAGRYWY